MGVVVIKTNTVEPDLLVNLLSYFFVKKIPLSRRVKYVMDGSMDESVSQ